MVKCPFCNNEMPPHKTSILSTTVEKDELITNVRHEWHCQQCKVNISRIILVRTVIP